MDVIGQESAFQNKGQGHFGEAQGRSPRAPAKVGTAGRKETIRVG